MTNSHPSLLLRRVRRLLRRAWRVGHFWRLAAPSSPFFGLFCVLSLFYFFSVRQTSRASRAFDIYIYIHTDIHDSIELWICRWRLPPPPPADAVQRPRTVRVGRSIERGQDKRITARRTGIMPFLYKQKRLSWPRLQAGDSNYAHLIIYIYIYIYTHMYIHIYIYIYNIIQYRIVTIYCNMLLYRMMTLCIVTYNLWL